LGPCPAVRRLRRQIERSPRAAGTSPTHLARHYFFALPEVHLLRYRIERDAKVSLLQPVARARARGGRPLTVRRLGLFAGSVLALAWVQFRESGLPGISAELELDTGRPARVYLFKDGAPFRLSPVDALLP